MENFKNTVRLMLCICCGFDRPNHVLKQAVACVFKNKTWGLFTWREEDPSTRKILEGETNFRLVYMQKFRSGWLLEIK